MKIDTSKDNFENNICDDQKIWKILWGKQLKWIICENIWKHLVVMWLKRLVWAMEHWLFCILEHLAILCAYILGYLVYLHTWLFCVLAYLAILHTWLFGCLAYLLLDYLAYLHTWYFCYVENNLWMYQLICQCLWFLANVLRIQLYIIIQGVLLSKVYHYPRSIIIQGLLLSKVY